MEAISCIIRSYNGIVTNGDVTLAANIHSTGKDASIRLDASQLILAEGNV